MGGAYSITAVRKYMCPGGTDIRIVSLLFQLFEPTNILWGR